MKPDPQTMKRGDLVVLFNNAVDSFVCVGSQNGKATWQVQSGSFAVYIKKYRNAPSPASYVLIDNKIGWLWDEEISVVSHATAAAV